MNRKRTAKIKGRRGKPLTVYLSEQQAAILASVSKHRQVPKSTLIRYALDRLIEQIRQGQLELPLGIEE